ncbi:hypothetical protein HUT18_22760 [Streptomyces sp. NA04227]|uniref:hypothetical protein n=1 Tax=Streptomyces sp. NA04227 TaxID=2742136 RepID=UPI00159002B6|nr:hypothetical protein [Streptomyces sp. NA04227]QKW08776.1 hypothetical protein HUT18_22760 [Streptomyces sp. NA04227]
MADEHNRWLSPEAAERLLGGEALGGVDDHARAQAERLRRSLAALREVPQDEAGELPGEEAALAAFRSARKAPLVATAAVSYRESATAREASPHAPRTGARRGASAGGAHHVVSRRVGGDTGSVRWGRPVRWGMAAAVAACMIGGVAVAGSAGVLPSPFKDPRPAPASSVSPDPDEEAPLSSGFPDSPDAENDRTPRSEGSSREPGDKPSSGDAEAGGGGSPVPTIPGLPDRDRDKIERPENNSEELWRRAIDACRQYKDGTLAAEKRRALEEAAKGAERLDRYCTGILDEADGKPGDSGKGDGDGKGGDDGDEDEGSGEGGNGGGGGRPEDGDPGEGTGETPAPKPSKVSTLPATPSATTLPTTTPTPAPDPTRSPRPTGA